MMGTFSSHFYFSSYCGQLYTKAWIDIISVTNVNFVIFSTFYLRPKSRLPPTLENSAQNSLYILPIPLLTQKMHNFAQLSQSYLLMLTFDLLPIFVLAKLGKELQIWFTFIHQFNSLKRIVESSRISIIFDFDL